MPKSKRCVKAVELVLCFISLIIGMPLSIALAPQQGTIQRDKIDPELVDIRDESGEYV